MTGAWEMPEELRLIQDTARRFMQHDVKPVEDRLEGSLATAVWTVAEGAAMVRAHDVAATVQAVRIVSEPIDGMC